MTIRFRDYRTVENYGVEIYRTEDPEDARRYMRENKRKMRFLTGGGKFAGNNRIEYSEIYWDVVSR